MCLFKYESSEKFPGCYYYELKHIFDDVGKTLEKYL